MEVNVCFTSPELLLFVKHLSCKRARRCFREVENVENVTVCLIWRQTFIKTIYLAFVRKTCRGEQTRCPSVSQLPVYRLSITWASARPTSNLIVSITGHPWALMCTERSATPTRRRPSPEEHSVHENIRHREKTQINQLYKTSSTENRKKLFTHSNWIFVFLTRVGTKAPNKS